MRSRSQQGSTRRKLVSRQRRALSPLRFARLSQALTLDEVASVVGVSPGQLSRIERGFARLTSQLTVQLADLYARPELRQLARAKVQP
jgi:transcriptional regulator with XRE-family HTH domain